ncbi:MAG: hypothetical protein U0836_22815 [Pirellulales bacterium]
MASYFLDSGDQTLFTLGVAGWLTGNVVGLVLVVIARLPWHWFRRAMLALGVVAAFALLPGMQQAPAYDLVLLVFAQACVVLAPWLVFPTNASTGRLQRRFSLSTLLLLMPPVAIVTALAVRVPSHVWEWSPWLLLIGAIAGVSTLCAAAVGLGKGRWWARLLAFFPALPSFGVIACLWFGRLARRPQPASSLTGRVGRWLAGGAAVGLGGLMFVPFVLLFHWLATAPRLVAQPLPPGNGLDDLERVGKQLPRAPDFGVRVGTPWATNQELDQFVQQHASEFALARAALERECHAHPYDLLGGDFLRYGNYRNLARGYQAASTAAARNRRPDEAVQYGLECYRLGREVERGGILIDALVGSAIEGIAVARLADVRHFLDRAATVQLIRQLLEFDRKQEAVQTLFARERGWQISWLGYVGGLQQLIGEDEGIEEKVSRVEQRDSVMLRLLAADLAVRAYFKDHGQLPETLDALVPEYLPAVPLDPYNDEPLRYYAEQRSWPARLLARRFDESHGVAAAWLRQFGLIGQPPPFVVYSVGVNETDEGGMHDPELPWGAEFDFLWGPPMNWTYESLRPYFDWDGV